MRSLWDRLLLRMATRSVTDSKRKSCVQCEIWRELYESEKAERREIQYHVYLKFGVIDPTQESLISSVTGPIQRHRPSQILRELEIKKRQEARELIEKKVAEGALNAAES
jgi:hypothetical protein